MCVLPQFFLIKKKKCWDSSNTSSDRTKGERQGQILLECAHHVSCWNKNDVCSGHPDPYDCPASPSSSFWKQNPFFGQRNPDQASHISHHWGHVIWVNRSLEKVSHFQSESVPTSVQMLEWFSKYVWRFCHTSPFQRWSPASPPMSASWSQWLISN